MGYVAVDYFDITRATVAPSFYEPQPIPGSVTLTEILDESSVTFALGADLYQSMASGTLDNMLGYETTTYSPASSQSAAYVDYTAAPDTLVQAYSLFGLGGLSFGKRKKTGDNTGGGAHRGDKDNSKKHP